MSGHATVAVGNIVGLTPPFPPASADDAAALEPELDDDADEPPECPPLELLALSPPTPELDVPEGSPPPSPPGEAAASDEVDPTPSLPPTPSPNPDLPSPLPFAAHAAPKQAAASARNDVDETMRGVRTVHSPRRRRDALWEPAREPRRTEFPQLGSPIQTLQKFTGGPEDGEAVEHRILRIALVSDALGRALLVARAGRGQTSYVGSRRALGHYFRVAHVIHLIDVVKRWDVRGEDLLAGSGVTAAMLEDPRATLPVPTMVRLLERARTLTREPALGAYIGLHTRATLYGSLGFAVLSAATIREAIDVSLRFGPIVTTALTVRFREDKRTASLIVDEHADFGSVRDIVVMTTLVALRQVSVSLTSRELTTSTAEFSFPEPDYASRLGITGLRMRFGRPVHQLTFDARSLDLPYTMPSPSAFKLAGEQCQRELDALGLGGDVVAQVRGLIAHPERGARTLEQVAEALHRSPRTLKRQLGAQGASFSGLRDAELRERAMVLLRAPELSLADVASRLGYSNVTNFERAFFRWTATTPATCRRTMGSSATEAR